MSRELTEQLLVDKVEELRASGEPCYPGVEIAPIAYRRWISFPRRNKANHPTDEQRITDLRKGLQTHFEPEIPYTHPADWQFLAETLADVLKRAVD